MTDTPTMTARLAAIPAISRPCADAPKDPTLYVMTSDTAVTVGLAAHLIRHRITPPAILHTLRLLIDGTGWLPQSQNHSLYQMQALAWYTHLGDARRIIAVDTDGGITVVHRHGDQPIADEHPTPPDDELISALVDLKYSWQHHAEAYEPFRKGTPHQSPEFGTLSAHLQNADPPDGLTDSQWQRCRLDALRLHAIQVAKPHLHADRVGLGLHVRDTIRADVASGELDFKYANRLLDQLGLPWLRRNYQIELDVPVTITIAAGDEETATDQALDALRDFTSPTDADWNYGNADIRSVHEGDVSDDDDDVTVTW